jgi:hypothetical protein
MRHIRPVLTLLGLAASLWAADPFVGTWSLNVAKSKYKTGNPPKQQAITIMEEGDNLDIAITGTAADGSPISARYLIPIAGGKGVVKESPAYDEISTKRIDANTRENTYRKSGQEVLTVRVSVSRNGKSLTAKLKGTDMRGNPVEGTLAFDKL